MNPMTSHHRCVWMLTSVFACLMAGCGGKSVDTSGRTDHSIERVVVSLSDVTRQTVAAEIEFVGNLLPRRRSIIVAEVDGVIENIPAPARNPTIIEFEGQRHTLPLDIGSVIQAGDVLIQIDDSDYLRILELAKAKYEQTKATLEDLLAWRRPEEILRLESLVAEASVSVDRETKHFERAESLIARNGISHSEYDSYVANLNKAKALLGVAEANLAIGTAGPTKTQVSIAKAALTAAVAEVKQKEWKVEKCTIFAPYDGVITDRWVDVGDRVTALPRVEILEVMDISFLVAQVGVPEKYAGKIQTLDSAEVQLQGKSSRLQGIVVRVNNKIDSGSRTFRIRVAIKNDERKYRVGQFARVIIKIDTASNALAIPPQAISYSGGQPNVFVFDGDKVHRRSITLGIINDRFAEVTDGLAEGEQVVVDDPAVLTDGMPVRNFDARSSAKVGSIPE